MAVEHEEGHTAAQQRSSAALWERVETQGRDIRILSEETASQFRDFRAEVNTSLGGVIASVEKLGNRFEANAAMVADRQRPQYLGLFGAMVAAVGLSVTIIQWQTSLHDKPVDDKLSGLTVAIGDLTKNTTAAFGEAARNTVSQREFSEVLDFRKQLQDTINNFRDKQIAALEARVDRVQAEVVPRAEITIGQQSDHDAIARLQAEITAANDRTHEVELRFFNAKPVQ